VTANSSGAYGSSTALSRATPNQFVFASGGVSEGAGGQLTAFGGVAQTSLSYAFEIVDPKVGVQRVLTRIRANGVATTSGQGDSSGDFDLVQTGPSGAAKDILDLSVCSGEGCFADQESSSFSYAQKINLLTNTGYVITLTASAGAFNTGAAPFTGAGTALIDPYFALDSSVADPGDYTLLFSPGIINSPDNVGSAPEPSTWAMMLLGFAGLAFVAYRASHRSVTTRA
jgi:PEP-CTERM motif